MLSIIDVCMIVLLINYPTNLADKSPVILPVLDLFCERIACYTSIDRQGYW